MNTRLSRLVPLGCDGRRELRWLLWGLAAGFLVNLRFVLVYLSARSGLYVYSRGVRQLVPGAVIAPFSELLGWSLLGCFAAAAAMAVLAAWHYLTHFRGSRSIYTMRRLPSRWELHRRCLTLPALGAAAYLLEAAALWGLDFLLYALATPAQCLPGIWGI